MLNFIKNFFCKHEYYVIGVSKSSSNNDVVHLYCPHCKKRFAFRSDEWERIKNIRAIDEEQRVLKGKA